jgi:hypothetical protein
MVTPLITKIKKVVGGIGYLLVVISSCLEYNQATLLLLFPSHGAMILLVTRQMALTGQLIGGIMAWWGKHPWASPSVSDLKSSTDVPPYQSVES